MKRKLCNFAAMVTLAFALSMPVKAGDTDLPGYTSPPPCTGIDCPSEGTNLATQPEGSEFDLELLVELFDIFIP